MDHSSSFPVDVMKPVVAGQFYPSDPAELSRNIRRFLEEADIEPARKPVLVILSPHAGYVFSGSVAGISFRHVQDQNPDTVFLIALSHRYPLEGGCVFAGKSFETPLGLLPVDLELIQELLAGGRPVYADSTPYMTEHSVEVNLPFVQTVFPQAKIASMLVSRTDLVLCRELGTIIAKTLRKLSSKRVLIVVSSDMSHFPSYDVANRIDREMLQSLESLDPIRIYNDLERLGNDSSKNVHCAMCGGCAMLVAVEAAREMGATEAKTLCYRNSGDTSYGESHRVVGYGSLAIYGDSKESNDPRPGNEIDVNAIELTDAEKITLLNLARHSIQAVLNKQNYEPVSNLPHLKVKAGVFVTLKNRGQLRGCLGRFEPADLPLYRLVAVMAAQSATHDIRFRPLSLDELPAIDIQISVLTPSERITDIREIEIGKHGLQIHGRNAFGIIRSGTLLPQVAIEQKWDVDAFLDATCIKAGLDADSWKDPQTEIWKYGAIVFGDLDFSPPPYSISSL